MAVWSNALSTLFAALLCPCSTSLGLLSVLRHSGNRLGSRHRRHTWKLLHSATGVAPWPKMSVLGSIPASAASMGDAARYLASYGVPSLQRHGEGWSTAQIQTTVTRLMADTLGIEKFDWDQSFVQDLGINYGNYLLTNQRGRLISPHLEPSLLR